MLGVTRACGHTYDTNNGCLLRPFYEPGTVASALHVLSHLILKAICQVRYYQPQFISPSEGKLRVREMK